MDTRVLTSEQQSQWAIDGYLVLKNVLTPSEVKILTGELDRLYRSQSPADQKKGLNRRDLLSESDAFIQLIDHPAVFDLFLDLMGPYIQLSMAQALIRKPDLSFKGTIHTDGGQAMRHIRVTETSWPLQIKIQYFLTDVTQPNCGNFTLFPGSHFRPFPEGDRPVTVNGPGALQLEVKAGDAALFAHSLWHGVAPNRARRARKSLIYCYSQMCFRPFDFYVQPPEILDRSTPRQRRLLCDLGDSARPGAYFYSPADQAALMESEKGKRIRKGRKVAG